MRYTIRTVTPANEIPLVITLPAAKGFLRVDGVVDDDLIEGQIRTAMEMVERHTSQVLTERELEMVTASFPVLPELISLPRDPVTEILSIKFTDPDIGAETVMDESAWRWADSAPDQVLPAFRTAWPIAAAERGSVRVRFTAGYEEGLCPPLLIEAVQRTLVPLYDQRGAMDALTDDVMRLCQPLRRQLV